ncbi:MAG: hypothetical protein N3D84_02140 [Candidatus Woesearchaeota archaeon]|nr:hypothetical protein [Candidatus Woesearchaeota archaeon]
MFEIKIYEIINENGNIGELEREVAVFKAGIEQYIGIIVHQAIGYAENLAKNNKKSYYVIDSYGRRYDVPKPSKPLNNKQ